MNTILLVSNIALWVLLVGSAFLLLGTLRSMGLLEWRLDQMEATRPTRIGRDGLKPGKQAPNFTLPSAANGEVSLHDFAGRKVLLVFTQSRCSPCQDIIPELNRLQEKDMTKSLLRPVFLQPRQDGIGDEHCVAVEHCRRH